MKDLKTLSSITEALESRIREYQSIVKHGGLRRSIRLRTIPVQTNQSDVQLMSSWGMNIRGDISAFSQTKVYGSVRWVPTKDFEHRLEQIGVINEAFRQVFDLEELDAATVWDILPWSWLLDFFTNIGEFLEASEDNRLFDPWDICITWQTDIVAKVYPRDPGSTFNTTSGTSRGKLISRVAWNRQAVRPPVVRFEFLTQNQISILLALFLSKKG